MISQILQHAPSMVRDITSSLRREAMSHIQVSPVSSLGSQPKESKSGENVSVKKRQTEYQLKRHEGALTYTKSLKTTLPGKRTIKVI